MALKLMDLGYTKVFALKGGWKDWLRAGFPTEKADGPAKN